MRQREKSRRNLSIASMTDAPLADTLSYLEEAWEEGAKEAAALAVSLCASHKQPPPYWVALAVACLVSPKYQHDMIHVRRWHLVRILRAEGVPWRDVYIEASERLADEGAACAPSAVRKSYESVQKQLGALQ